MNIFENASRRKFRFKSPKGELTTEQLWDLPLTSSAANSADLNNVAKIIAAELRTFSAEENFVATTVDRVSVDLQSKLEVVKHVIAHRVAENEKRRLSNERAEKRKRIMEAMAAAEDRSLSSASMDELKKMLDALELQD